MAQLSNFNLQFLKDIFDALTNVDSDADLKDVVVKAWKKLDSRAQCKTKH